MYILSTNRIACYNQYKASQNTCTPLDPSNASTTNCQKPAISKMRRCENIHIRKNSYPRCTLDGIFTPILKISNL